MAFLNITSVWFQNAWECNREFSFGSNIHSHLLHSQSPEEASGCLSAGYPECWTNPLFGMTCTWYHSPRGAGCGNLWQLSIFTKEADSLPSHKGCIPCPPALRHGAFFWQDSQNWLNVSSSLGKLPFGQLPVLFPKLGFQGFCKHVICSFLKTSFKGSKLCTNHNCLLH